MDGGDLLGSLQRARSLAEKDAQGFQALVQTVPRFIQERDPQVRQWLGVLFEEALTRDDLDQPFIIKLIAPLVITLLKDFDSGVVRSAITCASTLYPNLFKEMCVHQDMGDLTTAESMRDSLHEIKQIVLGHYTRNNSVELLNSGTVSSVDNVDRGVEFRAVKFIQQVVLTQSQGPRDPRLVQATNDISISFLQAARNGPVDNVTRLEAESAGLLDRLLQVFTVRRLPDASIVTATINVIGPLVRVRPTLLSQAMRSLLSFDSSKREYLAAPDMQRKFIDKCLKNVLSVLLRTTTVASRHGPQIEGYLKALADARATESLTRQAADLQALHGQQSHGNRHGYQRGERDSMGQAAVQQRNLNTDVPGGEVSFTWVYSLLQSGDPLLSVNARQLPMEIVAKIAFAALAVNSHYIDDALNVIKTRLQNLAAKGIETAVVADVEPEAELDGGDRNELDVDEIADNNDFIADDEDEDAGYGHALATVADVSFLLPEPSKLSDGLKIHEIIACVDRIIGYGADKSATTKVLGTANKGIERVALSEWNKNAWIMLVSRLFTRGLARNEFSDKVKSMVREKLYGYTMDDFRAHMDAFVLWLTEEFFATESQDESDRQFAFYISTTNRAFDHFIPLLEETDTKLFLRILSDLPYLDSAVVGKIKSICIDPYRSKMGFRALKYLAMYRPPTRDACLDLLQEMFIEEEEAKHNCAKILKIYRPEFLESQGYKEGGNTEESQPQDQDGAEAVEPESGDQEPVVEQQEPAAE